MRFLILVHLFFHNLPCSSCNLHHSLSTLTIESASNLRASTSFFAGLTCTAPSPMWRNRAPGSGACSPSCLPAAYLAAVCGLALTPHGLPHSFMASNGLGAASSWHGLWAFATASNLLRRPSKRIYVRGSKP